MFKIIQNKRYGAYPIFPLLQALQSIIIDLARDGTPLILSDITGSEDASGDVDFKDIHSVSKTLEGEEEEIDRGYNVSLPHNKIPNALSQLAKKMASHAMPVGEDFQPEAAIFNYIRSGDKLGGHLDDMKVDWSKPIGSPDEPLPMFLCTGMIVLMLGEAREHFHGVPQMFSDAEHAEMGSLEKQFRLVSYLQDAQPESTRKTLAFTPYDLQQLDDPEDKRLKNRWDSLKADKSKLLSPKSTYPEEGVRQVQSQD
ncbi:alpha-ketoglutarate-dependent dioxygenase AlkB [Tanacetum coccineum]